MTSTPTSRPPTASHGRAEVPAGSTGSKAANPMLAPTNGGTACRSVVATPDNAIRTASPASSTSTPARLTVAPRPTRSTQAGTSARIASDR